VACYMVKFTITFLLPFTVTLTCCHNFEICTFVSVTMRLVLCLLCMSGCKAFPLIKLYATVGKITNMNQRLTLIDSFPRNGLQLARNAVPCGLEANICLCLFVR
jgi:hypothetical protein